MAIWISKSFQYKSKITEILIPDIVEINVLWLVSIFKKPEMHEIKYVKPKLITTPKKPITFSERPDFFKRVRYVPNYFLYRYFDENICFAVFFASKKSEKISKSNFTFQIKISV